MATHVVVLDTTLRRTTVKVNPGTYMTEILEEACKKWGFKASNYGLKNNNKSIDLSRTFRQTGLVSGAKLELVLASKSPSVVSVALQVPETSGDPGGRLMDKFPSDTTLWLILRKFESNEGRNLNFTGRGVTSLQSGGGTSNAGRVFYEMPAPNIMGREMSTFGDLQKTLAQLGVNSGSVLIRLNFRKTEQPLEEAMVEIGRYFKEEEATAKTDAGSPDASGAEGVSTVTDDLEKVAPTQPSSEDKDVDMEDASRMPSSGPVTLESQNAAPPTTPSQAAETLPESDQSILGPNDRPIQVYAAPSSDTPKAALVPHNETDYEPSIAHAKQHQALILKNTHNQRLPSDTELLQLEKEKEAKLAATKQVTLKIRFPDQSSIVSTFTANDSSAQLYDYAKNVIAAPEQPFKLVYNEGRGPQTIPRDDKKMLIRHLGFKGQVLINFVWEDGASTDTMKKPVLKSQYAQNAKAVTVPDMIKPGPTEEEAASNANKGKEKEPGGAREKKPKGMPKWLKLGKK